MGNSARESESPHKVRGMADYNHPRFLGLDSSNRLELSSPRVGPGSRTESSPRI